MGSDIIAQLKSEGIEFSHKECTAVGYHGTTQKNADKILEGGFDSTFLNPKAWLGAAHYFYDSAPLAGAQYALCFATYRKLVDPVVLEADLNFKCLLDLNDTKNEGAFWKLYRFLRDQNDGSNDQIDENVIDENFIAFFIGTQIAKKAGSDGVGWKFPLSEPPEKRSRKHPKQRGFAVKKLAVMSNVRRGPKTNK